MSRCDVAAFHLASWKGPTVKIPFQCRGGPRAQSNLKWGRLPQRGGWVTRACPELEEGHNNSDADFQQIPVAGS